jgi:L-seryl-tRNA(Ser) seleniumtransferase
MATKTSDFLSRLPSASDLLDKPPIRSLVNRWNRSVVAAGVRSFLDELRHDFERRTADVQVPSIRELAERAARYVLELQQPALRPTINATGQFRGAPWCGAPLADAALERIVAHGRDFVSGPARTGESARALGDAAALVCRWSGAQEATVVHSYAGALWLFLAATASNQEFVVSRAELGDVEPGCPLTHLSASTSAILREVGTTNRTTVADYEAAVSSRTAALVKIAADNYRVVGETDAVELDQLVGLARERELTLCAALGGGPLVDQSTTHGLTSPSARACIAAGADLVVLAGDGWLGGPTCGILAGRREIIERIEEHPLFPAWQVDPLSAAALLATLELYGDPEHLDQTLPLFQLLGTSVENLRHRAERLAPQMAAAESIASADAVETQSSLCPDGLADEARPSYGIALTAADGNVAALDKRLRSGPHPVCGRVEGDRLVLDLRTVFPRQDQELAEAIVGKTSPPSDA